MGGASSKKDAIVGRSDYAWWTLSAVRGCFERALELAARRGDPREDVPDIMLTRKDFMEVFTDISVLRPPDTAAGIAGGFLSLDLKYFDLFCAEVERPRTAVVPSSPIGNGRARGGAGGRSGRRARLGKRLRTEAPGAVAAMARGTRSSGLAGRKSPARRGSRERQSPRSSAGTAELVSPQAAAAAATEAELRKLEDEETAGTAQTVDAVEVLLVLAFFCTGTIETQLRLAFDIIDVDQSGELTIDEVQYFFLKMSTAAVKVCALDAVPSRTATRELAEKMFAVADRDGSGSVEKDEFVRWARTNVISQGLLSGFVEAAREESLMHGNRRPTSLQPTADGDGARRGQQSDAETAGMTPEQAQRRQMLVRKHRAKEMGKKIVKEMAVSSGFDVAELRKMRNLFEMHAGEDGELSREQFSVVLTSNYPGLDEEATNNLFDIFDADGGGTVDIKEYVLGMSQLAHGDTQDKIGLLFEVFDSSKDGKISVSELQRFVSAELDSTVEGGAFTEEIVQSLDKDGDGTISRDEFVAALSNDPVLYDCFANSVMKGFDQNTSPFARVTEASPKFNLHLLGSLWKQCQKNGEGDMELTEAQFRRWMTDTFSVPFEMAPLLNRMFAMFDVDKSGFASWREVYTGLAQLCNGDQGDRAALMFELYDRDGGGDLSRDEVIGMLSASQGQAMATKAQAEKVLAELDTDGNGGISLEEFKAACEKNKALLEVFSKVFGPGNDAGSALNQSKYVRMTKALRYVADQLEMGKEAADRLSVKRYHRELNVIAEDAAIRAKKHYLGQFGEEAPTPEDLITYQDMVQEEKLAAKAAATTKGLKALEKVDLETMGHIVRELQTEQENNIVLEAKMEEQRRIMHEVEEEERRREWAEKHPYEEYRPDPQDEAGKKGLPEHAKYLPSPASLAACQEGKILSKHAQMQHKELAVLAKKEKDRHEHEKMFAQMEAEKVLKQARLAARRLAAREGHHRFAKTVEKAMDTHDMKRTVKAPKHLRASIVSPVDESASQRASTASTAARRVRAPSPPPPAEPAAPPPVLQSSLRVAAIVADASGVRLLPAREGALPPASPISLTGGSSMLPQVTGAGGIDAHTTRSRTPEGRQKRTPYMDDMLLGRAGTPESRQSRTSSPPTSPPLRAREPAAAKRSLLPAVTPGGKSFRLVGETEPARLPQPTGVEFDAAVKALDMRARRARAATAAHTTKRHLRFAGAKHSSRASRTTSWASKRSGSRRSTVDAPPRLPEDTLPLAMTTMQMRMLEHAARSESDSVATSPTTRDVPSLSPAAAEVFSVAQLATSPGEYIGRDLSKRTMQSRGGRGTRRAARERRNAGSSAESADLFELAARQQRVVPTAVDERARRQEVKERRRRVAHAAASLGVMPGSRLPPAIRGTDQYKRGVKYLVKT